jgi:hypothetical protein
VIVPHPAERSAGSFARGGKVGDLVSGHPMSETLSAARLQRLRSRLRWQHFWLNTLIAVTLGLCILAAHAFVPPPPASQHRGDPILLALFLSWGLIMWWHIKRRKRIYREEGAFCAVCGHELSQKSGRCYAWGCSAARAVNEKL